MRRELGPVRRRGGQTRQQERNMLEIRSQARVRRFWARFIENKNVILEKLERMMEQLKKMMKQLKKMLELLDTRMGQENRILEQLNNMTEPSKKMMEQLMEINEHLAELLQLAEELKLRRNRAPE